MYDVRSIVYESSLELLKVLVRMSSFRASIHLSQQVGSKARHEEAPPPILDSEEPSDCTYRPSRAISFLADPYLLVRTMCITDRYSCDMTAKWMVPLLDLPQAPRIRYLTEYL